MSKQKPQFMTYEEFEAKGIPHVYVFASVKGTVIGTPEAEIARKKYGRTVLGDHPLHEGPKGITYAVHHRQTQIKPVTVDDFKEQMKLLAEHIKVSEIPFFIPNLTTGMREADQLHQRVRGQIYWIDTPQNVIFDRLWMARLDPALKADIVERNKEYDTLTARIARAHEQQKNGTFVKSEGTMFRGAWATNISGY